MGIKQTVARQYREIVNRTRKRARDMTIPPEGWIRTVRKALGMSGAQLAHRLGVTRAMVSVTEKAELEGGVTLKTMQRMAAAMNSRFVYAIVPNSHVEKLLHDRAMEKAVKQVMAAGVQMALEDQLLSDQQLAEHIKTLAAELLEQSARKLWTD